MIPDFRRYYGPEFANKAVGQWAAKSGVNLRFVDSGKPMQNAYVESFNGKFRDGCLSQHWFVSLEEARGVSEQWRVDYNEWRPHRSLQHQTRARSPASSHQNQFLCQLIMQRRLEVLSQ